MPRICHGSNLLMDRKESDYCLNPSPKGIEGGGGAAVKWLINEIGGPRQREGGTAGEGGPLSGFVPSLRLLLLGGSSADMDRGSQTCFMFHQKVRLPNYPCPLL